MIPGRLYISDLDGTLLGRDRRIGRRTLGVLERFLSRGGLFTVATGRSAASCESSLGELRPAVPIIAHNGALTFDLASGVVVAVRPMAGAGAAELFAEAIRHELGPVGYGLDDSGRTWLLHGAELNAPTRRYVDSLSTLHPHGVDDGERLGGLRPLSLILLDQPEKLSGFLGEACGAGSGFGCSLGRSAYTPGLGVGEVQAEQASKGAAAIALAATLGLTPEAIVAFGDNCNDLSLLRRAGRSYCPPESQPEVLAEVQGRIASPEDEGVAAFLEALLDEERLDRAGPR